MKATVSNATADGLKIIDLTPQGFNTLEHYRDDMALISFSTTTAPLLHLEAVNYGATIDRVREWGLKFGCGKYSLLFIGRAEELAILLQVDVKILPRKMPVFFNEGLWPGIAATIGTEYHSQTSKDF